MASIFAICTLLLTAVISLAAFAETSAPMQDVEARIFSVGTTSFSSKLTSGQSAHFRIEGLGDLKDCTIELSVNGHVTNTGVKVISMNGRTVYTEPFTVAFPAGYPKNSYASISMVLKPISGCALSGGGADNRLMATFPIWSGPAI
ncbi:MAG: hypothetical protein LH481_17795 [Burkholderiales bacterium]|nr:hypothetical protein [Burkholderiales bacterium]